MGKQFLKNDKFRKARGGYSRLLNMSCEKCSKHVCFYQKDGPGELKRMYFDRITGLIVRQTSNLLCSNCKEILGVPIIYKKEKRPAYRLFVGAVKKSIVKT